MYIRSTRFETDDAIWGTGPICGSGGCHWILFEFDPRTLPQSWYVDLKFSDAILLNIAASLETVIIPASSLCSYNALLVTIANNISPHFRLTGIWPDHDFPEAKCLVMFSTEFWYSSTTSNSTALCPRTSESLHP